MAFSLPSPNERLRPGDRLRYDRRAGMTVPLGVAGTAGSRWGSPPIDDWDDWMDALHEDDVRQVRKPKSGHVNRIRVSPKRHALKIDAKDVPEVYHPFIYAQDGRFLDEWGGFQRVYAIRLTAGGRYLWAGSGFVNKFLKYDLSGRLIPNATWATFGIAPGAIWGPHYFDTTTSPCRQPRP